MKESIFGILQRLCRFIGYYEVKAAIKMHFYKKRLRKEDEAKRIHINEKISDLQKVSFANNNSLVVSLTSYGHRIISSLPYTLFSLINQDILPSKLVVFLSEDEISCNNLPPILKKLEQCGILFYYVKDIKSYKKLIPALSLFPDNPILTVDDDMYYDSSFIKVFLDAYNKSDKKTVLGTIGRTVTRNKNGTLKPYSEWDKNYDENYLSGDISFYGCGGCLYPPHIFDEEIFNEVLFMKIAPTADDLWFWVMEQRCGIKTQLVRDNNSHLYTPVDRTTLFELNRPDCLTSLNDGKKRNDVQLQKLVDYYGII